MCDRAYPDKIPVTNTKRDIPDEVGMPKWSIQVQRFHNICDKLNGTKVETKRRMLLQEGQKSRAAGREDAIEDFRVPDYLPHD